MSDVLEAEETALNCTKRKKQNVQNAMILSETMSTISSSIL
jgi:hypothetical protein